MILSDLTKPTKYMRLKARIGLILPSKGPHSHRLRVVMLIDAQN